MTDNKVGKNQSIARFIFGVMFVVLLVATGFLVAVNITSNPNVVQVENVFADINGDGTPDLIVKGSVILNTGQTNF